MCGTGSSVRNAMLNSAAPEALTPPGFVAVAAGPAVGWALAAGPQGPAPAVIRTVDCPGFQAACGTRTSIWRRLRATVDVGAGVTAAPPAVRSWAVVAWTVRNSCAGELTPAPCGHGTAAGESPSAMVKAVRSGALSVLSVTRK